MRSVHPGTDELLNVYDATGAVVGRRRRAEAKAGGLAVGAVMVLIVNRESEVLLQRRALDKENGGLWDKSVGGHVLAGEDYDHAAVRETGEELFDDGTTRCVRLKRSEDSLMSAARSRTLEAEVLLCRAGTLLNLRDVRHAPEGGLRNVRYHVGLYLGRTDMRASAFRRQPEEVLDLRFVNPPEIDEWLVAGHLAPNMALLWLALGWRLLALVEREPR